MKATMIAMLILVPAVAVFAYADWTEYRRWKHEGPNSYGLTYCPDTNTTHVGPIPEGEESFDPEEFDPSDDPSETDTPDHAEQDGDKMTDAKTQIQDTISANDVVLYMKGTKEMPQCGFSSRVAGMLNYMGVQFQDVNVLADEEIRQGIKDFSDWPTIPQLYVKGEFVGGCDIITEMTLSGELDQLFEQNGVAYDKDAAEKIREANA